MLATESEALATDKEFRTVEETSRLLAITECRSSTISESIDCSTARTYECLADCFDSDEVKRGDSTHPGEKQFQEFSQSTSALKKKKGKKK